jgi:hypothetical protein
MTSWTPQELDTLSGASEIQVAGRRKDGTPRTLITVWHVVLDGKLYVRSVYGPEGNWYRGVIRHYEGIISWRGQIRDVTYTPDSTQDDAIDAAYFAKYGKGAPSQHITSAAAKSTTLRIDPR